MRPNLNNLSGEKEALSLLELNTRIRGALSRAFPETCWVRAEMSDVRVNTSSGHCYLEFVEKNAQTGQLVALSLIHISEPTRLQRSSRMPSSA